FEVVLVEVEAALERPIRHPPFAPQQFKHLGQDLVKRHARPSIAVCLGEHVDTVRGLQRLVKTTVFLLQCAYGRDTEAEGLYLAANDVLLGKRGAAMAMHHALAADLLLTNGRVLTMD